MVLSGPANKKTPTTGVFLSAPTEIRTRVLALKGLRPSPLDHGGNRAIFYHCMRCGSSLPEKLISIQIKVQSGMKPQL